MKEASKTMGLRSQAVLDQYRQPQANDDTRNKASCDQLCIPEIVFPLAMQTHSRTLALYQQQFAECLPCELVGYSIKYSTILSLHIASMFGMTNLVLRRQFSRLQKSRAEWV